MKIENMLQRFSCISFLFKSPWYQAKLDFLLKASLSFPSMVGTQKYGYGNAGYGYVAGCGTLTKFKKNKVSY